MLEVHQNGELAAFEDGSRGDLILYALLLFLDEELERPLQLFVGNLFFFELGSVGSSYSLLTTQNPYLLLPSDRSASAPTYLRLSLMRDRSSEGGRYPSSSICCNRSLRSLMVSASVSSSSKRGLPKGLMPVCAVV